MSNVSDQWSRVAGTFGERVRVVPAASWANASPCAGWTALDVVGHLVEWVPPFLRDGADVVVPNGPPVDEDPVGAWSNLSETIQAVVDAPDLDSRVFDHPVAGHHTLSDAISKFVLQDVLIHTWDLARATGQDETLDDECVATMLVGLEAIGDALERSGQFARRVAVPDDVDALTKLLALTGRRA